MINVNQDAWNQLTQAQRNEINTMAMAAFGAEVTPDTKTPAPQPLGDIQALGIGSGLCKLLCTVAEQGAKLLCQRLPSPAKEVCIQAADAGGDFCMSKCK